MTEFSKKVCRRANRHVSYNAPGYPGTHSPVCKISRQPPFLPFAQSPVSTCCVSRKASQCTQPERSVDSKTMPLFKDLLNPNPEEEKAKHKLKRLVQSPNSYFMDVKCPGCYKITTVFSHAQTVVLCVSCSTVLCQPTGGRARLTEGCSFRRKH
ncbi:small ribosomal subunit protein eS27-like [Corticium candelabrum]|uniref:small ribosomal subunit protein eS27-like n=1 Tax=Corticium candelabrum TaxID=121492 RepID=UPI002E2660E5|nr:small ribosomal subunit protein eS27-like [Corticium candelabrum]